MVFFKKKLCWVILFLCLVAFPGLLLAKTSKTVHVLVALCDNVHQGIVPVPKALGDGESTRTNLYWGARYGVKTHFKKSSEWLLEKTISNPSPEVLERLIFRHHQKDIYLVADAYRGSKIRKTIHDFFNALANQQEEVLSLKQKQLGLYGKADLLAYIGHNGLMDFLVSFPNDISKAQKKDAIVLACMSKPFFEGPITAMKSQPLLLTTGFMAPEAYTLEAALTGWILQETQAQIQLRAAKAYHRYQKTGLRGAKRLFDLHS